MDDHSASRPGPCAHLGAATKVYPPNGQPVAQAFACQLHGECTQEKQVAGVAHCPTCNDYRSTWSLVAPIGTADRVPKWEGRADKRPWQYQVTAILPHLNTVDLLEVLIDLLRLQTEPPFIVVVDTGSPPAVCERIERLRYADCEIHYIRANAYTHSSEPVTVALDLGFARVHSDLTFLTHTDCFPMRCDALAWLGAQCNAGCPVVGWQMSDRSWASSEWQGLVSHTFTMCHSQTMRKIGATWHIARGADFYGLKMPFTTNGWPDTETSFGAVLKANKIVPKLLGGELNYVRQTTEWWDHARSITGSRLYCGPDSPHALLAEQRLDPAYADAIARVKAWRAELMASGLPVPHLCSI